jgi:predicted enzyme related to lactoylglutathione lyase
MVEYQGRFAWYELLTTDVPAARVFYAKVLGWEAQDAPTPVFPYTLFNAGKISVSGAMGLPEEATRMGATPRWMGYVGVKDVDATANRIEQLGGTVYVPPTDSNIGRISVVADPQKATLALVDGLKPGQKRVTDLSKSGCVGWHELLAADWEKAFAFYRELFGWQKAVADADTASDPADTYQLFSAGGQTIGGMFTKLLTEPVPFWLFYFNIDDIDAGVERVKSGGGQVVDGPLELPDGSWFARCIDPQGAVFSLQGKRNQNAVGWRTEWGEFASKGRLVTKAKR